MNKAFDVLLEQGKPRIIFKLSSCRDKSKPVEKPGRKATDLRYSLRWLGCRKEKIMFRRKFIYWFIILLFTILPIAIDFIVSHERNFPFIWSIFLIPSVFIIFSFPNWKSIIGTGLFYSVLEFMTEFFQGFYLYAEGNAILLWSMAVNWSILLIIGYLIIQNEKLLKQVHSLTLIDPLTELYNRRYVDLYMERTLPYVKRTDRFLLVAVLDIDHFKKINDRYGHLCGDEALKHFVTVVKENIRESDMFARLGGEEFLLTLIDTPLEEGLIVAEQIRSQIESSPFIYKGQAIFMTASLGLIEYKKGSLESLLETTDKALYKAKETGRNKCVVG